MRKLQTLVLSVIFLFAIISPVNAKASKIDSIVNDSMNVADIIKIANNNDIKLSVKMVDMVSEEQKKEMVSVINSMYINSKNKVDNISSKAIDGSSKKKTLKGLYKGDKDINGTSINYTIEVWVPCQVYIDSGYKQITKVYDDEIDSFCTNTFESYKHIDDWYAIAPKGAYATVSGRGDLTVKPYNHKIVPFTVTVYPQ